MTANSNKRSIEWPTLLVAAVIYAGFGLLTWYHTLLPWWVILPLAGYLVAWQGSLQHEVVHGHPTRNQNFNRALVFPSLWLWLPYLLYEKSHTAHHQTPSLTDPLDDPESFYVTPQRWAAMGPVQRTLKTLRNTLLGRLLIGPIEATVQVAMEGLTKLGRGDLSNLPAWALHLLGCGITLYWVMAVCGIDFWTYVLLYAYPGTAFTLLRSFAEHQANENPARRTAIIETNPLISTMFLNNNLHVMHHDTPGVAWYELPAQFRARRAELLSRDDTYYFAGYGALVTRYLTRPKEPVLHPHQ